MDNIIIPVVDENLLSFAEQTKSRKNELVIMGIVKSLSDKLKSTKKKNIVIKVFEDGSKKEEIINSLRSEIEDGKVVICRKGVKQEELNCFLASTDDITVCEEKRGKISNFLFNI